MAKIAYFDCFSGISGDMTIGALLDAGLDRKALGRGLAKLGVAGYGLKASKVRRAGIAGTKFDVVVKHGMHSHRSLRQIQRLIGRSALSAKVKALAQDIFGLIGSAEAKVHGIPKGRDIDFHELGHIDSVVDIVGTAIAIDEMGIDEIYSSPVTLGRTIVMTHHGNLPIPGPACMEILKNVPVKMSDAEAELVTPTGAGIVRTLAKGFGAMPQMEISAIGYGAGTRELAGQPNMLRVVIGQKKEDFLEDDVIVMETNIDDMSPQPFQYLFERLFEAGALDVYTMPVQMKKSRPGFKLTVLAKPEDIKKMAAIVMAETSSIGIRYHAGHRFKLQRRIVKARTRYGDLRVKVSTGPDIITVSPEYDDCSKIARSKRIPFKVIYEEAKRSVKL